MHEQISSFESREPVIDQLINQLAERESMLQEDILSDIITFAPYDGNETSNPDYIEQVAEMIGISLEEMNQYAIKKARDFLRQQEEM